MVALFQSISTNILTPPAYIVGLLVLIGMLALKKPWYEALGSMIKAVVGYLIMSIGSGLSGSQIVSPIEMSGIPDTTTISPHSASAAATLFSPR